MSNPYVELHELLSSGRVNDADAQVVNKIVSLVCSVRHTDKETTDAVWAFLLRKLALPKVIVLEQRERELDTRMEVCAHNAEFNNVPPSALRDVLSRTYGAAYARALDTVGVALT